MKQQRNVISLLLKRTEKQYFFGSLTAIYDHLTVEDVGAAYNTLRVYFAKSNQYENDKCLIIRGELLQKNSPEKSKKAIERIKKNLA